jgi:hypothetical protein
MINGQREIWISTGNKSTRYSAIIAVSNCGRIMRRNGKIEIASKGQQVFVGEKRLQMYVYRFLATNFIAKTEEDILKQRTFIDHITHAPDNVHINDIRNLRWCTNKENCNFPEAKLNQSKAKIGEKHPFYGKKHSEEAKEKIRKARKGKKHSEEAKEKISKNSKAGTPEVRAKISAAKIGNTNAKGNTNVRGRRWYNNGITSIMAYECPIGFVPGQLRKKKSS